MQCESAIALNVDGSFAPRDDIVDGGFGLHKAQPLLLFLSHIEAGGGGDRLGEVGRWRLLDENLRLHLVLARVELVETSLERLLPARNPSLRLRRILHLLRFRVLRGRGGLRRLLHQWLEPLIEFAR